MVSETDRRKTETKLGILKLTGYIPRQILGILRLKGWIFITMEILILQTLNAGILQLKRLINRMQV